MSGTLAALIDAGEEAQADTIACDNNTNDRTFVLQKFGDVGMSQIFVRFFLILAAALFLVACAPEIVRTPVEFVPRTGSKETIQLLKSARIPTYSGASNTLFAGTRWESIGEIGHGKVFRSRDSVFFVQGANSHEAYLVVKETSLVGFYLPGERAWSPLESAIALEFASL